MGSRFYVRTWVETARDIYAVVEQVVVRTATGVVVAIGTGDLAAGLGAGVTARVALGTRLGTSRQLSAACRL